MIMPKQRMELLAVIEIDTDAYAAAALEEEAFAIGEVPTATVEIANLATGHFPIEDAVPRWARHAITVELEHWSPLDPRREDRPDGTGA